MSGKIIYRPPLGLEGHHCDPPRYRFDRHPDEPPGTIWECECGQRWTAGRRRWRRGGVVPGAAVHLPPIDFDTPTGDPLVTVRRLMG